MCVGFAQGESSLPLRIRQFLNCIFPLLAGHHESHDQALVIPVLLAGVSCLPGNQKNELNEQHCNTTPLKKLIFHFSSRRQVIVMFVLFLK